jgi:hypothetical protein
MTHYGLYLGIALAVFILWTLIRPRKQAIPPKMEPILPDASAEAPAEEQIEGSPGGLRVVRHRKLDDEPAVFGLEGLEFEITVEIAKDRTDMIDQFERYGALDNTRIDGGRSLTLYGAPASLVHEVYPQALETLKMYVALSDRHKVLVINAYGVFSEVEREFKEFLHPAPNWSALTQERGVFIEGKYFTSDSFLYVDNNFLAKDIRIAAISRKTLEEVVHAELERLKNFLSGIS